MNLKFPRFIAAALSFAALPATLLAQASPRVSAQVMVGVHAQISAANAGAAGQYRLTYSSPTAVLWDNWEAYPKDPNEAPIQSPNIVEPVTPNQLYTLFFSCAAVNSVDFQFDVPAGYTLYMGPQYQPMTPHTTIATPNYAGGTGNFTIQFYLQRNDGTNWLAPGYSAAPRLSDVTWAVSAGQLASGLSAGVLRLQATSVTSSLADAAFLSYQAPVATVSASQSTNFVPPPDTVGVYYDTSVPTSPAIKFIATQQAWIYIRSSTGPTSPGYTIEFYSPATTAYTWPSGVTGAWQFTNLNGGGTATPYVIYTISNPSGNSLNINQLSQNPIGTSTESWLLTPSTSGGQTTIVDTTPNKVTTTVSTGTNPRTEQITYADNNSHVAAYRLKTYQVFSWGEELVSDTMDPTSMDPSGLNLTTAYTYYDNGYNGHYAKLQSVAHPDGSWVYYDYYDDFARWGELAGVYTPWQDGPATVPTSATLSTTNCKYVAYNYVGERSVYKELFAGTATSILGIASGEATDSPVITNNTNYSYGSNTSEPIRTDTVSTFSAAGTSVTSVTAAFHNEADLVYNGKLYSQVNPDGTMTSCSYWLGTCSSYLGAGTNFNATTFNPSSQATTWVETDFSGTSAQQDSTAVQLTTDGITGGKPIAPIWMTPYKSFRKQTLFNINGSPSIEVTSVFTGGSNFQIIGWKISGYDVQGLLNGYQTSTGEKATYNRVNGNIVDDDEPNGIQLVNTYDPSNRLITSYKEGVSASGSFPSQPNIVTSNSYDALDHLITSVISPPAGTPSITKSATYNLAGLITSSTDTTGLVTTYSYTNGARTVTTTYPNGSTSVVDRHLDGSPKSTTGNAGVNAYTAITANSDGTQTSTTHLATSNSARYASHQVDWMGRPLTDSTPAFSSGTNYKRYYYNTAGQLKMTTQTGMAQTLYQYDGYGHLQYTALDANNNYNIDFGGPDRVTQTTSQIYEDSNSVWWNRTESYVYPTGSTSTTGVLVSDVRQLLVPYSSNVTDFNNGVRITQTNSYDMYGNLTTEVLNSSYTSRIATDTTTLPDSTVPKVTTTYNGLLVSSQTPQNITTTYQYDVLGRQISQTDPRKGTSSIAYYPYNGTVGSISQISSRTDEASNSTSYTYDSTDGRLASQTDPKGNVVYHAYDHAGREIKTWGPGTYPVEYAFDAYGSKIAMRTFRNPTANFTTSSWPLTDDADPQNPIPTAWTTGDITTWNFDAPSGLLTSKVDATGKSVAYTYNSLNKLATRTWARGVVTTYTYDPNTADQTGISYSDGTPALTFTFDCLGHRITAAQAYSGFTVDTGFQYSVPGKLTQEALDATYFAGRQINWQLDSTGVGTKGRTIGYQLGTSSAPTSDQSVTYGYDSSERFNSEGLSGGPTFTYAFVPNSNLIASVTDSADNWTQARSWEPSRDLLTSIQTSVGSTVEGGFAYVYDQDQRRSSKVATGSLFSRYPAGGIADVYSYDSKSQLQQAETYQSTNPSVTTTPMLGRNFQYQFDQIGNWTSSSVDTNQTTYSDNALNEITSRAVPGSYSVSGFAPTGATITVNGTTVPAAQIQSPYYLEPVSVNNSGGPSWNAVSASSSLGGSTTSNAWLPQSPENYTYDADGNLLTDGRWHYAWDGENRLLSMETIGHQSGDPTAIWNSGVPLLHIDFKYDYKGRRISKMDSTWNGTAFAETSETRYVYCYWNMVADYAVSGSPATLSLAHTYLWGTDLSGNLHGASGVGGLLAFGTASGLIELPVFDGNGNVMGLTDRASGLVTAAYEYSPFGDTLRKVGSYASINPVRFSSKYTDDETKLIYYGRRYYSSSLGRFLGRDPIGEKGGLHLYAFTGNSPVNRYDFRGMDATNNYLTGPEGTQTINPYAQELLVKQQLVGYTNPLSNPNLPYAIKLMLMQMEGAGEGNGNPLGAIGVGNPISTDSASDWVPDANGPSITVTTNKDGTYSYTTNDLGQTSSTNFSADGTVMPSANSGAAASSSASGGGQQQPPPGNTGQATGGAVTGDPNATAGPSPGNAPNNTPTVASGGLLGAVTDIVGMIWSLPNTAIGLAFGAVGYVAGTIMGTNPGISIGPNAINFTNNPLSFAGAITLGNTTSWAPGFNPTDPRGEGGMGDLQDHETQHTIQGQELGPLYLPANLLGGIISVIQAPSGSPDPWHYNNFMENGPMSWVPKPWPP